MQNGYFERHELKPADPEVITPDQVFLPGEDLPTNFDVAQDENEEPYPSTREEIRTEWSIERSKVFIGYGWGSVALMGALGTVLATHESFEDPMPDIITAAFVVASVPLFKLGKRAVPRAQDFAKRLGW